MNIMKYLIGALPYLIFFVSIITSSETIFWVAFICSAISLVVGCILWIIIGKKGYKGNKQLKKEAEQNIAAKIEAVKGNSLKKELVKRKLVREYMEKYKCPSKVLESLSQCSNALLIGGLLLVGGIGVLLLTGAILLIRALAYSGILSSSYGFISTAILAIISVGILIWKRYYIMALVATCLAVILNVGIYHIGGSGIDYSAVFHLVKNAEGSLFRSPTHAGNTITSGFFIITLTSFCMMVYPFLKKITIVLWVAIVLLVTDYLHMSGIFDMSGIFEMTYPIIITSYTWDVYALICAINAELSTMIGMTYYETYMLIFVYALSLLTVICAASPYIKSLRACQLQDKKVHRNETYTDRCNKQYRIRQAWLIINIVIVGLVCGHFIGMPLEEAGVMLARESTAVSCILHCSYELLRILILVIPAPLSIMVSWILDSNSKTITK